MDAAVQASVEQAILDDAVRESAAMSASAESGGSDTREGQNSFAALSESENELGEGETPRPSRYASAVSGTGPSTLVDSAFPPLPGGAAKNKHKHKNQKGPASMAALLGGGGGGGGRGGGIRILNTAGPRPPSAGSSSRPPSANGDNIVGGWASSSSSVRPSSASSEVRPGGWTSISPSRRPQGGSSRNNQEESFPAIGAGPPPAIGRGAVDGLNGNNRAKDIPVVERKVGTVDVVQQLSEEELRAANRALKQSIQAGLRGNEQAFSDFKDVSARFTRGEMNTLDYYGHIIRLGLSRVVPELGRLCPDPVKGKELIEAHAAQLAREQEFPPVASGSSSVSQPSKPSSGTGKGNKVLEGSTESSRVSPQAPNEEVEVLSKDGYRTGRGKSRIDETSSSTSGGTEGNNSSRDRKPQVLVKATGSSLEPSVDSANQPARSGAAKNWTCERCTFANREDSPECVMCGSDGPSWARAGKGADSAGNDKRKKKVSKFQRVRLGDGSAAALLDSVANPNPWGVISDPGNPAPPAAAEVRGFGRGAWANGGGSRLMSSGRRN